MKDLFFWKEWTSTERTIYLTLSSIFLITLLYYAYSVIQGHDNALEWNITSTAETIEVPVKKIQVGLFEFELSADNYVINQFYQGSPHQITPISGYIFLFIFALGLSCLFTIATYFKRFWYLAAMTAGSFVFVSFRFEQLEIFGWIDNTFLIIVLSLILPLSYYHHAYKTELEFIPRLLSFCVVFTFIAILIGLFSQNQNPFYFLVHYNYIAPIVISVLFIFLVSHEIIYLILFLISGSSSQNGKNNLVHFLAFSSIYLLNVILLYLKNAFIIDWDLIYVNAFLLLIMSAMVGVWGFKQREIRYSNIILFRPLGGYLFLSLGIICFATIAYHTFTLNDPVLEAFEDAIVFSHVGFGIMFMLYLVANFINLFGKNLPIYKIAYKEDNMPYVSANLAGLVVVLAFYFLSNQASLQQTIAGYYNGLGSVYYHEGNEFLAEEYYKRGALFGYNNHRSNYSIGEMAFQQNDKKKAITWFKNATKKKPSEFAYVNLANIQKADFLFFDALFTLKEGLKKFPNSSYIKNNLGLLFKSTKLLDSAVYYMEGGASGDWGNKTNTTNIIDLLARNRVELPADSLTEIFEESRHLPLRANLIAYSNNTSRWLQVNGPGNQLDSVLDLHQFAYLYNYGFSKLSNPKEEDVSLIHEFSKKQSNALFTNQLTYLHALMKYMSNDLTLFLRALDQLQNNPAKPGYYNHMLGTVALEQSAPTLAIEFFRRALIENYAGAKVNLAIALTEAGQKAEAIGLWNQIFQEDSVEVANDVLLALTAPVSIILNSNSDALKYQAVRYRNDDLARPDRERLLSSIGDINFQVGSYLSNVEKQIQIGNYSEAVDHIKIINTMDESSEFANEVRRLSERLLLYQVADGIMPLANIEGQPIIKFWLNANDPASQDYFRKLGLENPFNEAEVILASRYFQTQKKDTDMAYNILLNAIAINPHSVRLRKEYVLQAINIGLSNYALSEQIKLKSLMSATDYESFDKEVKTAIAEFDNFTF